MHGEGDYSRLLTKLYEDIVQFDEITISHRYPTRINGHYVIDPSPIPRYDVPQLHQNPRRPAGVRRRAIPHRRLHQRTRPAPRLRTVRRHRQLPRRAHCRRWRQALALLGLGFLQ
jgi:hypothetical protein